MADSPLPRPCGPTRPGQPAASGGGRQACQPQRERSTLAPSAPHCVLRLPRRSLKTEPPPLGMAEPWEAAQATSTASLCLHRSRAVHTPTGGGPGPLSECGSRAVSACLLWNLGPGAGVPGRSYAGSPVSALALSGAMLLFWSVQGK